MQNFVPQRPEQPRKTLAEMGVIFTDCYTCKDDSCSANVIHKQSEEEFNVFIRKYSDPNGQTIFYVNARPNSNTSEQSEMEYHFPEEDALVGFLCATFSGFKCF